MRKIKAIVAALWAMGSLVAHAQVTSSAGAVTSESGKIRTGYDGKGFFLRSNDDDFSLQLAARLQFQHDYERNALPATSTGRPTVNTFKMRRANFYLLGKIFEKFEFTLAFLNGSKASAAVPTMNWAADMTANIIPAFNVTVGSLSLPFDRLNESSSGKMTFNEVPITATQQDQVVNASIARLPFGPDDDLGIRLWGDIGKFHYIVGVANGFNANFFNANTGFQYGGRVWFDVMGTPHGHQSDLAYTETPTLSFGLGGMFDPEDAEAFASDAAPTVATASLDRAMSGSFDTLFQYKGFTFLTEIYGRKTRVKSTSTRFPGITLDDFGYYAQASYFIVPKKFEVAVRGAQIFREGSNNDSYEFGGGLNYYIKGNNVKVQLDGFRSKAYGTIDSLSTEATKATKVRTMLTFNL